MANKKKEVTKAPSGLKITRSGNKFTASWKIGDKDYGDGQYLQYLINDTGKDSWQPTADSKKKIGVKVTSKAISIDKDNFYPNKDKKGNNKPVLYEIGFRVKGNRKKYTTGSGKKKKTHSPVSSEWTEKRFTVNPPKKPTLTVELDEELTNVCKFSWSAPYASDDSYIFTDTQWQTILVKNNSETDGSKLSWKGSTFDEGTAGAESSKTITEDTAILYRDGNSYTRWFRVRARGPGGVSQDGSYGWVYKKHVYALPNKTNVTSTSAKETDEGGFQCIVDWTVGQSNNQKPIDKVTVQYTIVVPDENLSCPNGASWTDANISRDTADGDAAVFSIDEQLGKDQCLFIRVNTQHDSNITYGKPKLSSVGFLKDPTGLSVQTDNVTHKATINATNVSDVEDSVLVVRYVPAEGDPIDVGVIPHGSSSVTVQCPNWDEQTAIGFEVYAMVGEAIKQTREDGVDSYAVTPKMRSQNTVSQGGAVPVAPKNVNVSRVENKPDTVQVTWDWPWSEAGSAEISWSDHDDAWESTDEPESFLISNLHASKWNISGLETGKTWYVRVRLIAGNMSDSETVTYGPWSDISQGSIDLSSAPNKPVLILSDSIIPEDGSTTASWVYTTTDNTAQAYAEVAVVENGEYIPISHSLTAQHVTIDAISAGFTVGNVYNLSCMVKSASGRNSEWSDVVSVAVAEPLECDIPVSSLVFESKETNPREFEGNPIEFDTELGENIRKLEIELEPTQLGEGTPSPNNVRPIIGTQKVNILDEGRNLINWDIIEHYFDSNFNGYGQGKWQDKMPIPSNLYGKQVTYSAYISAGNTNNQCVRVWFLKGGSYIGSAISGNYIQSGTSGLSKVTFTIPNSDLVNSFALGLAVNDSTVSNPQLELGAEATDYVPYIEPIEVSQEFDVSLTPTVIDRIPYSFKATGDVRGDRLSQDLVGGTVNWNQLVTNVNKSDYTTEGVTFTVLSDGRINVNGTAAANLNYQYGRVDYLANHVYIALGIPSSASSTGHFATVLDAVNTSETIKKFSRDDYWTVAIKLKEGTVIDNVIYSLMAIDLTVLFGSTIADYIYSLEQANVGAGVAFFRKLFPKVYYTYNTGELISVKTSAHQTVGKNLLPNGSADVTTRGVTFTRNTDGTITASGTATGGNAFFTLCNEYPMKAGTYYISGGISNTVQLIIRHGNVGGTQIAVSSGTQTLFTLTEDELVGILYRISEGTKINEKLYPMLRVSLVDADFEPYTKNEYLLDSNLELRGIPKLDDNNNLYYDGDTYASDGTVTRNHVIDVFDGASVTNVGTDSGVQYARVIASQTIKVMDGATTAQNMMASGGYSCVSGSGIADKTVLWVSNTQKVIRIFDNRFTDLATAQSILNSNPIYVQYPIANPTTETAPTFADPQVCSIYGTEEFVDEREVPIPVGHVTTYKTRGIFGGTIDLKTGLLTINKSSYLFDGSSDEDWVVYGGGQFVYCRDLRGKAKKGTSTAAPEGMIASEFSVRFNSSVQEDYVIIDNDGDFRIQTTQFDTSSIDSARSWLQNNPLQTVYPLATPQTYQLTPHELETLIGKNTVLTENGNMSIRIAESYEEGYFLTKMPLEATVTGIEEGGKISVIVERAEDYKLDRPDEDEFNGYEGETILQKTNSNPVKFETEEMTGSLDDGAKYNLIATIQDGLGQKAEKVLPFTVKWEHQALEPSAEIVIDEEQLIAKIRPIAPQGADPTDVADIYRLSADKPELIYSGANFGEWYVDPYPALGDMGGHRIVLRTKNGDYITADNQIAMVDSPELGVNPIENEEELNIIDFNGRQIQFYYDTDYSNTWAKDFQETQYLGGSIQGDWNPAVSRSGTLSSQAITVLDQEMLKNVRRLAEHSGICHVRTADGSSYAADVQVSEDRVHDDREMLVNYSLSITRVDSQGFDGMTLESWESEYPDEEEEPEEE